MCLTKGECARTEYGHRPSLHLESAKRSKTQRLHLRVREDRLSLEEATVAVWESATKQNRERAAEQAVDLRRPQATCRLERHTERNLSGNRSCSEMISTLTRPVTYKRPVTWRISSVGSGCETEELVRQLRPKERNSISGGDFCRRYPTRTLEG